MTRWILWFLGMVALCCLAVWAGLHHPAVPYNVREIFEGGSWFRGGLFLTAVLHLGLGSPMLVACLIARHNPPPKGAFVIFVTIQSFAASLLTVLAAPAESVHDLVGSPTLDWPDSMEVAGRLAGFLGAPLAILDGAALLAVEGVRPLARWDVVGSIALAATAWYVVVVYWANTDNVTELLPKNGHSLRLLALALWVFLMGLGVSVPLARAGGNEFRLVLGTLLFSIIAVPVGWMLLTLGTEGQVLKYGKTFSALQFLLSPNRHDLVSGTRLFLRYGAVHAGLTALGLLCQISIWRLFSSMGAVCRLR
ncbi:MAG: hypothetical protein ACUVWY_11385 [Desulfosoma sp.]|uniref:hypothetical protein n=1 Tax=Desulfosoma sp. TaxID=2603217 RepID=UPI0040491D6C